MSGVNPLKKAIDVNFIKKIYSWRLLNREFPKRISFINNKKYFFWNMFFNKEVHELKKLEKKYLKEKRYQINKVSLALSANTFYWDINDFKSIKEKQKVLNDINEAMKLDPEYFKNKEYVDVKGTLNLLRKINKSYIKEKTNKKLDKEFKKEDKILVTMKEEKEKQLYCNECKRILTKEEITVISTCLHGRESNYYTYHYKCNKCNSFVVNGFGNIIEWTDIEQI